MSIIFTIFGILSFVMFAYAVYAQNKLIVQLRKVVHSQRTTIESLSTPLPPVAARAKQRFDEDWDEIKKIFEQNSIEN